MRGSLVSAPLLSLLVWPATLSAQLNAGLFKAVAWDEFGRPEPGLSLTMTGGAGSLWRLETNPDGEVWAVLPYGGYQIRGENGGYAASFVVSPLRTTACELSRARGACTAGGSFFAWAPAYPVSYSLAGRLLHQEPGLITEPLDFSGLGSALLPWVSDRAISWTATLFRLQGMNATDSYQPGRPAILPDTQALADVIVQTGPDAGSTPAAAAEVGLFVTVGTGLWPVSTWHGEISADSTGSPLAANNLPAAGEGGYVLQPSGFNWYTRDHAAIGGPVTRWADLLLSATGQWDSQAAPLQPSGNNVNSRLLFGNAKGRIRTGRTSQLDAQFTGSRRDQSGWNLPAGVEALDGRRMAPPLVPLADLGETDHLDFVQAGWTRQIATSGLMELRYGYSTAHLDTRPNTSFGTDAQSRIEMNGGMVAGPPPLSNMAVRTRHQIEFAAEPGEFCLGAQRHRVVAGAGWQLAGVRNRFSAPSDLNLITADGSPASVLELNTPLDSRARDPIVFPVRSGWNCHKAVVDPECRPSRRFFQRLASAASELRRPIYAGKTLHRNRRSHLLEQPLAPLRLIPRAAISRPPHPARRLFEAALSAGGQVS